MATNNNQSWLAQLPGYVGALMSIGSLVFSVGILYSDVNTLKADMNEIYVQSSKQEAMMGRVNVLQVQVERNEQMQDKLSDKLDNIDRSLSAIQVGLARLEERLPEAQKQQVRK